MELEAAEDDEGWFDRGSGSDMLLLEREDRGLRFAGYGWEASLEVSDRIHVCSCTCIYAAFVLT